MSRTQTIALAALVAIVAVAAGILSARWLLQRQAGAQLGVTTATLLAPPRPLPPLALVDQDNRPFDTQRLRGRWSLLFFGFTSCPDVCPTTMTALAQTNKLLADLPGALRPRVIMISVDPERDTPERLGAYVKAFDPTFVGATGTKAAIDELAQRMGVLVATRPLEGEQLHRRSHDFGVPHRSRRRAARAVLAAVHAEADRRRLSADRRRMTEAPTIRPGDRLVRGAPVHPAEACAVARRSTRWRAARRAGSGTRSCASSSAAIA